MPSTSPRAAKPPVAKQTVAKQPQLLYGLDDRPPVRESLFVAVQHVCAIFIPIVTPGLMIAGALGLDANTASYILGMSLFVSGLGTFIQVRQFRGIGSGLLSIQGTSFAFVTPILAIAATSLQQGKTSEETLSLILGLCFCGSLVPIVLSRFLHLTSKLFTPLVTGTAVTLIGLCLVKVGMFYMAGGGAAVAIAAHDPDSPLAFGSLQNWALAIAVFAIVGGCSASSNRYLRMGSIIVGLLTGFVASIGLGIADFSHLSNLPLLNVPMPFRFGLAFDGATFISFIIIYLVLTLEALGDITATSLVSDQPIEGNVYIHRLKGGILGDGINSLIASICGTFPIVTPAQNNGIIQLTGVGSRYIGFYVAGILAFLGLFPWVGGVLLAIPTSVFGGAIMLMFGSVTVAGFNILREVEIDNRAFIILAVSLTSGLGVTFAPEALQHFPSVVKSVLESGVATGSICALVLNLVLPQSERLVPFSRATTETEVFPKR
ncbi:uracil-xanthine permease family protein [Myxacorys almedinensis]|uniref:Xanthine permease XanP n=1 Tax=Myxacorys almedinensis A TaxID=2690445 RepID=A0A8J7Z8B7_9CYAN|nr:nucleobase:cation symporter-2 family protein [Myxacorys almedinensis]NDJ18238.1 xanthine permease XanP [Myxacorys almedinensis A]